MGALLAEVPALPLHTAGKYVAAVYIVLFVLVLVYVAIMAVRLSRIERDLGEMLEMTDLDANRAKRPEEASRALSDEAGGVETDSPGTAAGAPR